MEMGIISFLPVPVGGEGGKERTYSFTRTGFGRYLFIVKSVFLRLYRWFCVYVC